MARDDGTSDKSDEINERIGNKTGTWGEMKDWTDKEKKEFLD